MKEPSWKPQLEVAVGKNVHTIIYQIRLASQIWASLEALGSPQKIGYL